MYRLVAIDLDGTLLNQYGVVTENTKKTINKTIENGTDVILASGRPIHSIETIADEIGSKNFFIAGNGALIYDMKKQQPIYEKMLDKQKILEIAKICEDNSITYNIYTPETIIAKDLKYNVLYYYKENLQKDEKNRTSITMVDNIKEYVEKSSNEKFLKVTICDESKTIFNSVIRKLKEIKNIEVLEVGHMSRKTIKQGTEDVSIEYYYTEISLQNVNKWQAIENLIDKLNIKKEEVIAIGDNMNDAEMIKNAGLGIAMGQSAPQVKQIADYITDDNENEGVKKALEKYCV